MPKQVHDREISHRQGFHLSTNSKQIDEMVMVCFTLSNTKALNKEKVSPAPMSHRVHETGAYENFMLTKGFQKIKKKRLPVTNP